MQFTVQTVLFYVIGGIFFARCIDHGIQISRQSETCSNTKFAVVDDVNHRLDKAHFMCIKHEQPADSMTPFDAPRLGNDITSSSCTDYYATADCMEAYRGGDAYYFNDAQYVTGPPTVAPGTAPLSKFWSGSALRCGGEPLVQRTSPGVPTPLVLQAADATTNPANELVTGTLPAKYVFRDSKTGGYVRTAYALFIIMIISSAVYAFLSILMASIANATATNLPAWFGLLNWWLVIHTVIDTACFILGAVIAFNEVSIENNMKSETCAVSGISTIRQEFNLDIQSIFAFTFITTRLAFHIALRYYFDPSARAARIAAQQAGRGCVSMDYEHDMKSRSNA